MRVRQLKNIKKDIKDLTAKQTRAKILQKKHFSEHRQNQILQREKKIKLQRELKNIVSKYDKSILRKTKNKLYEEYKKIKLNQENLIEAKDDFKNQIKKMLARRSRIDKIYKKNIGDGSIQFMKGLDYFLRGKNLDITELLEKYDIKALSDAIYSNYLSSGDNGSAREFFGYNENYEVVEDNTIEVLKSIREAIEEEDQYIIDNLIKQYEESEIMKGFKKM